MFALISITSLLLAASLMTVMRIWRPGFGYQWLIAVGGGFAAWLIVLYSYTRIPENLQMLSWGPQTSYSNSIQFSLDQISWPFAAALGTLLLATLLSDVVRAYELSWSNWASSLVIIAIGLMGVYSANLLTFVLVWVGFDLTVLIVLLLQFESERLRRRTINAFFIHLIGTFLLLIAGVISVSDNSSVLLEQPSAMAVLFVLLAAGFRFGALPIDSQMLDDPDSRRSFGTIRSLASMGIVSVLLVRTSGAMENVNLEGYLWPVFFSLVGLSALTYGFIWFTSRDELQGRQAWILGFGMLIIGSTMQAELDSSLSWALALIFSGGLIFLASVRHRITLWITLLGVIGISTLPFTAAWSGLALFSSPLRISLIFYFFSIILMIAGYARLAAKPSPDTGGHERWIQVIYPAGLILLPVTHLVIGLIYMPNVGEIPFLAWIISTLIIILAMAGFIWQRRGGAVPAGLVDGLSMFLNYSWLRGLILVISIQLSRLMSFISSVLEGEGGILWVILSIVLFLATLLISIGN